MVLGQNVWQALKFPGPSTVLTSFGALPLIFGVLFLKNPFSSRPKEFRTELARPRARSFPKAYINYYMI